MARIVHLAIKVENLDESTKFYEEVFGFRQVKTGRNGQHVSRHMTDGNIDLALMVYDSEDAAEAQLAGPGPRLHHWGIEVDDRDDCAEKIKAHGGTILSAPAAGALKFRAPDGTVAEVVRTGRYADAKKKQA
jgi:lactoylglutathione lyase